MLGLIEKDIRLLLKRKQALLIFLAIALMMTATQSSTFAISYSTFLCAIFAISSVAYDESDNGYQFIMTLPVTRKEYVTSKYIFTMMGGMLGWIVSVVAAFIFNNLGINENAEVFTIGEAALFIPAFVIIVTVMLPIQLIFGAEKSRVVLALIAGVIIIFGTVASRIGIGESSSRILSALSKLTASQVMIGLIIIAVIVTVISYAVSVRFMEKKEF